jgi:hypothetical protein
VANIPGHVVSSVSDIVRRLEARVVPFIKDVVDKSVAESVDIAHDTAKDVLETVTADLEKLKTVVEDRAPTDT